MTPTPHECCWHTPSLSVGQMSYPPKREEVCCHCGARRWLEIPLPPIPEGHGPHYPRPFGAPIAIPFNNGEPFKVVGNDPAAHYERCSCNPKNGGSGVCGCVVGGKSITFSAGGSGV